MTIETIHCEPQIADVAAGTAQQPMTYRQFADWLISDHGFEHDELWCPDGLPDTSLMLVWLQGTAAEGDFPAWGGSEAFLQATKGYDGWTLIEPKELNAGDREVMVAVGGEFVLYGYGDNSTIVISFNADATRVSRQVIEDLPGPCMTSAGWANSL